MPLNNQQLSFADKAKQSAGSRMARFSYPTGSRVARTAVPAAGVQPAQPLQITNGFEPAAPTPGGLQITNGFDQPGAPGGLQITNGFDQPGAPGGLQITNGMDPLEQQPLAMARGGIVRGQGTRTSDSVPVALSVDEAVLPAKTVDAMGGPAAVDSLIEATNGKKPGPVTAGGAYAAGAVPSFPERARTATRVLGGPRVMAPPAHTAPPAPQAVGNPIYAGRLQSPGIYNPNGSTSSFDSTQMRAERAVAAGRGGATNPIRLGVGEIMPETAGRPSAPNFTLRGSVPAGNALVPTDGFDPAMRGKTSPLPMTPPSMSQRAAGTIRNLGEGAKSALGGLRAGANAMFSGQATPTDWKGIGKSVAGKAKAGLGKALSNFNTIENAIGAGDDLAMIAAAPNADMIEKFGAGAEALGNVAVGGLVDRFNAGRGFITGTGTSVANGAMNGRPVTQLSRMFNGRSAIDNIRASNYGETSAPNPFTVVGNTAKSLMNTDPVGATPSAKAVAPTSTPVATEPGPAAQQPTLSPWNRSDDLATEAKRQFTNATPIQDGGNGLLAQAEAGLSRARGQYAQGGEGGARAFRDPAVQAAFNARNMLEGTGIAVNTTKDGRTEFSGDNRLGGGKLYRAADGSVTNDWSKTQQYADAIQRNAKDQDRLAELTRGAALSGDKEAVARLTHGDQRLAGIAAEAATEKSLRDAVKGGSRNAAMVLADMEKSKATQAYQNVDLGLKRAALVSAQEDRDLNRQLRQDSLNAKVAENQRAAEKDTRETAQARLTTLDKQLEQYATVDGKLDGQKVARLRGLAANLQPSPGQSPEEFNKDVTTHVGLASKLDGMQAFYDRWFSQAGQGGTDLRQWKPNDSIRGGFVTDQGDHISTGQYNSLSDDEKAVFKKLYLKGGK